MAHTSAEEYSLVLPLETPTGADIEKGTHELQIAQDRRERLDRELEEARVRLKSLESERDEILDEIFHWGSFIAPFRPLRIPAEILSEIFRIFVIEDGGSPWTLTKVSRAFRRTALSTPRIWGGISVWGEERQNFGSLEWYRPAMRGARWEFGKENCCNAKQLRQALKRARAAPLDLSIQCRSGHSIAMGDKAKEMVAMVAGERLRQWRSLEFAVEENWDLSDAFSGSLEGLTFLRLLSFQPDLYNCLCKTARNLRNVEIYVNNQPLSKLANAPWWQRVHRLLLDISLSQIGSSNIIGSAITQSRSAMDILSKAIELEDLTVQFQIYNEFVPVDPPIHLPRLKNLVLRNAVGLLPSISASLLTHLEIQSGGRNNGTILSPGSIFLPAVTHLSSVPAVLASFYCPSLVELCLRADISGYSQKWNNDRMVIGAWSPDNDPEKHLKPSVLRIENLLLTWTVLRDLLRFSLHDCLRELHLFDSPQPKSFFKALTVVTPSNIICKDLQKLSVIQGTIHSRRVTVMGWDEGKVIFQDIFTLRREQNLGLRRVLAQWMKNRVEFGGDSDDSDDSDDSGTSVVTADTT